VETFEEIYPLLRRFPTHRMSKADWSWLLFTNPWADGTRLGYALYADGKVVGYIGTLCTTRRVLGRPERFCNPSSWIVLEEHRWASHLLLRPIVALEDHTLVCLTPSDAACRMFARLGLRMLETEQLVLAPVPRIAEVARACAGTFTTSVEEIQAELTGDERMLCLDLSSSPVARHVLLARGNRRCYLVATLARRRHVPYAEIQYLGDRELFWEQRLLAHAALFRSLGVPGLAIAVDRRFLVGRPPPAALCWKKARMYRPTRDDLAPELIDGLYSELMGIRY
jgi:hypothetical protein